MKFYLNKLYPNDSNKKTLDKINIFKKTNQFKLPLSFNYSFYNYITNVELINKIDLIFKKSIKPSLINLLIKRGEKIRYICTYNKLFSNFFSNFITFSSYIKNDFYLLYFNLSKVQSLFWSDLFFFNILQDHYTFPFQAKITKISKKLKKKNKIKYSILYLYLKKIKRTNNFFKQFVAFSSYFNKKKLEGRLYLVLYNLLFNPTKNDLYFKKIKIYENVLKNNTK